MANANATNALTAGDVLYWLDIDSDTPVVWGYECPVDTHKLVSAVQLASLLCPVHHATLVEETPITIATS